MIDGKKLFEQMLKLPYPWEVSEVNIDEAAQEIKVYIEYKSEEGVCSQTGEICKIYDRRERSWRHLDTMEYQTWIVSRLPRVKNSLGNYHFIPVEWAEPGWEHTAKFENRCIMTLKATHCQKPAALLMRISDDKMCGIMHRSVERGLRRRDLTRQAVHAVSIDEKSHGKGQRYISVLTDSTNGRVLDVVRDRTEQAADFLLQKVFTAQQLAAVQKTCCDMSAQYMNALKKIVSTPSWFTISFT
jgi:transposase